MSHILSIACVAAITAEGMTAALVGREPSSCSRSVDRIDAEFGGCLSVSFVCGLEEVPPGLLEPERKGRGETSVAAVEGGEGRKEVPMEEGRLEGEASVKEGSNSSPSIVGVGNGRASGLPNCPPAEDPGRE